MSFVLFTYIYLLLNHCVLLESLCTTVASHCVHLGVHSGSFPIYLFLVPSVITELIR